MYNYYPQHDHRPVLSVPTTSLHVDMNKVGTLLGMVDDEVGQGHDQLEPEREQFRQHVELLLPGHDQLGHGREQFSQHVEMLPPEQARDHRSLTAFSVGCPRMVDDEVGQGHVQVEPDRAQVWQLLGMLPPGPAHGRRTIAEVSAGRHHVLDAELLREVAATTSRFLDGSLRVPCQAGALRYRPS